ncbi:MAG: DUF1538 domain-containing protein [candidate division FCPU426 bacterium]
MPKPVRFGDYLRQVSVQSTQVSYNRLTPKSEAETAARERKLKLRSMDIYRLLAPYLGTRFSEQFKAVFPLALYLALFQWLVLRQSVADAAVIAAGLLAVMAGLMLFMEGLKLGLMPFGETIGNNLPRRTGLFVVLGITFLLGVGVTFAEPAIGALQVAGSIVDPAKAPYLHLLLNRWSVWLVLVVGAGVGLAAVVGTLRFVRGWSLKPIVYFSLIPLLALTVACQWHPHLRTLIGLAWDCGAVTTGPVTVPLVLALGIGVAAAVTRGNESLSGFGIVTLASLYPIMGVLLLGIAAVNAFPPAQLPALLASGSAVAAGGAAWYETTPGVEIVTGLRAIVPLILFLFLVLRFILRERLAQGRFIVYGLALAVAGMILFNLGLTYGLSKLGGQSGSLIPGAFTNIPAIAGSPLFSLVTGVLLACLFSWVLGFGATLAEPALNALGLTVENLTSGAFKKTLLMYAVSLGVACGITVGVLKLVFGLNLTLILFLAYSLALLLTFFSSEAYVNVAWDSAGVTTGPVTVPLVLAMGLGFGRALGVIEGFGVLAAASVFPILSVLSVGLYVQWRARRSAPKILVEE